jgi:hypothetical protein
MKGGPALSADEHRAALGECEIVWEVMEATIRIHPQTLRMDTSSDALDGVRHPLQASLLGGSAHRPRHQQLGALPHQI